MSRRGGGDWSQNARRGQQFRSLPLPYPSFQRGGGGRGRGRTAPSSTGPSQPPYIGGRSQNARRDQHIQSEPPPSPSFQRGGGDRGRGRTAPSSTGPNQPPYSLSSGAPAFPPATSSASAVPSPQATPSSGAKLVEQLAQQTEQNQISVEAGNKEGAAPPASSKSVCLAARPGFGELGRKYVVKANHFLVDVADRDLCHYVITITPEVMSKKVNRVVISQLVTLYRESHLGNKTPAYDGMKNLYTAGPLPFVSNEFVVKLSEEEKRAGSSSSKTVKRGREFKVAIKFAATVGLYHLREFLSGRQMDSPKHIIQALDIVLRDSPSNVYNTVERSFFSPLLGDTGDLGDGVAYWRGFYQSLRPTQMGLSLNVGVSASGFYEPIFVTDFVAKYLNRYDLLSPLSDQNRIKVKKALTGLRVELHHQNYVKTCKVTGLSNQPLNQIMFKVDEGSSEISIVQYFRERYNIELRYTSWPAVQSGSHARPRFLPMELCKISDGQRYSNKLNATQVNALLRATCERPNQREERIKHIVKTNNYNNNSLVSDEFGIQVKEELTIIEARILPPPMLSYHTTGKQSQVNPRFGSWNMTNKKMFNGGRIKFWACVNFSKKISGSVAEGFCERLIRTCVSKGMVIHQTPLIPIQKFDPDQIEKALSDIHTQCKTKLADQEGAMLQLLIIILPDIRGSSYGTIKRVCETELGIVSQCCQPKQASSPGKFYFENIALKINVKVGGSNNALYDAINKKLPIVTECPTIILGADVTHPPPGDDSSPSIAAVVASMDWPGFTKYRGLVSAQAHGEEIIQDLYKRGDKDGVVVHLGMIRELFTAFYRNTGKKPGRILFYRDGVSEGEFSKVLLYEVDAIREACKSLEEGYLPLVTFVVVQKRHHTRFFPAEQSEADWDGNVLPGLVVDTEICHNREFDFYLKSHASRMGTSRPIHYHVLLDENGFSADQLQTVTNSLCYTYARCTSSVSIVPPVYYAHLAAFRARYYIDWKPTDGSLSGGRKASGGGRTGDVKPLPVIEKNVKEVMFYC